jgi:hypothetical protein
MTHPSTVREALIAEALGEAAKLLQQVEALASAIEESRQALADAHRGLADQLAAFEAQVIALSEKAKVQVVKHILTRADEAARRSADLQSRAMADAARLAFSAELGTTMQRLQLGVQSVVQSAVQSALQPPLKRPLWRWQQGLTHLAVATTASGTTWGLMLHFGMP